MQAAWQPYVPGEDQHMETNGGAAPLHPLTYFREHICPICSTAAIKEHTVNLQKLEPGLKIPLIKCWRRCLERCSDKYSAIKCFPRNWEKSWTIWEAPRLVTATPPAEWCLGCREHSAQRTSFAGHFGYWGFFIGSTGIQKWALTPCFASLRPPASPLFLHPLSAHGKHSAKSTATGSEMPHVLVLPARGLVPTCPCRTCKG